MGHPKFHPLRIGEAGGGLKNMWMDSGTVKQATKKAEAQGELEKDIPQGLKPVLILRYLRHD